MFKILIAALIIFLLIWANKIRIYLKWQKKAEAENKPFYRWPESVHQEPKTSGFPAGNKHIYYSMESRPKSMAFFFCALFSVHGEGKG